MDVLNHRNYVAICCHSLWTKPRCLLAWTVVDFGPLGIFADSHCSRTDAELYAYLAQRGGDAQISLKSRIHTEHILREQNFVAFMSRKREGEVFTTLSVCVCVHFILVVSHGHNVSWLGDVDILQLEYRKPLKAFQAACGNHRKTMKSTSALAMHCDIPRVHPQCLRWNLEVRQCKPGFLLHPFANP